MKEFKIKLFKEENSGDMQYSELKDGELNLFKNSLKSLVKYKFTSDSCADFFNYLDNNLNYWKTFNDIDDPDLFTEISRDLKLDQNGGESDVYIVWRYPDEIDKFKLITLKNYWDYIWYSASDDAIVLVVPEKSAVILVTHYGDIKTNFPFAVESPASGTPRDDDKLNGQRKSM